MLFFRKGRSGYLVYRCTVCDAISRIWKEDLDRAMVMSLAHAPRIVHDCESGVLGIAELTGGTYDQPKETT